jgi:hypothetical protein
MGAFNVASEANPSSISGMSFMLEFLANKKYNPNNINFIIVVLILCLCFLKEK